MLGIPKDLLETLQISGDVLSARVDAGHAQGPGVMFSAPRKQSHGYQASPAVPEGPGCEYTCKFTQEVMK